MNIPKEIKILGIPYKIEEVEYISREDFRLGQVDFIHSEIKILEDMSKPMKEQTLLHEIIHATFKAIALDYTNEEQVQQLASALHQIITDNPLIFSLV